jgi:acetyltransferase-like isoleucine patch superfamily enzyme
MASIKKTLDRMFSWFPLYRMARGGHSYWSYQKERTHKPEDFLQFGKDAVICPDVLFHGGNKVWLGDGSYIGQECFIAAQGGFHLGNYSALGPRCTILTHEHQYSGGEYLPFGDSRLVKPVYIEDYVMIGACSCLVPGVRIGEGAIVGMGSVVTSDVAPLEIVMGNPAKRIGTRKKDAYDALKAKGAVKPIGRDYSILWIPPLTKRKYAKELIEFGFDTSGGRDIFEG